MSGIGDDTFTGREANETFEFGPIFSSDTITDFCQFTSGATHDTISIATSEFANFAAPMTAPTSAVTKVAAGDTPTLANLTTTTLAGLSADFTFHA